jgi:23S rRNA pseudouridine2605 synthase
MSHPPRQTSDTEGEPQRQRLQRALAAAGVASRRKAEDLIVEGRVTVDGQVVMELGTTIDPTRQQVAVDGVIVRLERPRYILLNKPKGYITTVSDERGRQTVMDLVDVPEHVKPVGRLDRPSEGLLFFTNDGELAYRIMHPSYEIDKEYEVDLDGHPPADALERVRRGISIDGERVTPSMVRPLRNEPDGTVVRVVIHEGRNRVVRRMFEAVGYPVLRLRRTRIGPLQIGSIPRGSWRDLTPGELEQIRQAVRLDDAGRASGAPSSRGSASRSAPPRERRPASGPGSGQRPDQRRPTTGRSDRAGGGTGSRRTGDNSRPPNRAGRPTQSHSTGRPAQPSERAQGQRPSGPSRQTPERTPAQRTASPPGQRPDRASEQRSGGPAGRSPGKPPAPDRSGSQRKSGPPRKRSGPDRRAKAPKQSPAGDRKQSAAPREQSSERKRPEPLDE